MYICCLYLYECIKWAYGCMIKSSKLGRFMYTNYWSERVLGSPFSIRGSVLTTTKLSYHVCNFIVSKLKLCSSMIILSDCCISTVTSIVWRWTVDSLMSVSIWIGRSFSIFFYYIDWHCIFCSLLMFPSMEIVMPSNIVFITPLDTWTSLTNGRRH